MHTAAMALAHLPPDEWAGWVGYLLQMLEEVAKTDATPADVESALEDLLALVAARREHGAW
jgi:hypothetical protein